MQALRLPVGTVIAALVDALIPFESHPLQVLDNRALGFRCRPLGVRVLDPQDERAALPARQQPIEESRSRVADMELACRTGSETYAHAQRLISATAWTAIDSPAPIEPTPSFVLPLMLTHCGEMPSARARLPDIASMCGTSFG